MTVSGSDDCAIHGYEPVPADYYRLCVECGHVYVTAAELVLLDQDVRRRLGGERDPSPRTVDEIEVCPLCIHDF